MIADAFARSAPGNARESIAVPTGVIMPPPTPCAKRNATSWPIDCARPHAADAMMKIDMAKRNTRFVPKRSERKPAAGMNTARLSR